MKFELFSADFPKILKYQISWKFVVPVGAGLFHADRLTDGQTDMTKLVIVFRNFANTSKNKIIIYNEINIVWSEI